MKMWMNYFTLQLKRSAKITVKSMGVVAIMGAMAVVLLLLIGSLILQSGVMPKVSIGISVPENEKTGKLFAKYVSSVESFTSLCDFEYLSEEEGLDKLEKNDLQAVIIIPDHFFDDVNNGLNPVTNLYLNRADSTQTELFYTLVKCGISLLQTSESGVYAALNVRKNYEIEMNGEHLGDVLAMDYLKVILVREDTFEEEFVSLYGDFTIKEYYIGTGVLLFLLFIALTYKFLYDPNTRDMEDKLKICGLSGFRLQILKIVVEAIGIFVFGFIIYMIFWLYCLISGSSLISFSISYIAVLLLVSFGIASITDVLFSIISSGYFSFFFYFLMGFFGGLFLPVGLMPDFVGKMQIIFPIRFWFQGLCNGLYGFEIKDSIIAISVWIIVGLLIGACIRWKKQENI